MEPAPQADSPDGPWLRQDIEAYGQAQQAVLGWGVQNVYFGHRPAQAEAAVSIAPPFGQRDERLPLRGRDQLLAGLADPGGSGGAEVAERLNQPTRFDNGPVTTGSAPQCGGRRVAAGDYDARSRVWVLHGLGGCGKTRLALEAAYQAQQRGTEVWWVSATESSGLVAGMRALGRRLGVTDAELDHGDAADAIWRRLATWREPWLLVIDNADDPQVLAGAGTRVGDGRGWLRPVVSPTGMVLVTSRDGNEASWGPWCRRHRLATLHADEAAVVLADHTRHQAGLGSDAEARELAQRLGGLPLALKIAGSYLAKAADVPAAWAGNELVRTYLLYKDMIEAGRLGTVFPVQGGELTQDEARGLIGRTWDLSLELLDARQVPDARRLLHLLATFADAPIPHEFLLHPATMSESPLFAAITGSRLWTVLQALDGFGLIDLNTGSAEAVLVTRLHPLVRDTSSPELHGTDQERAAYLDLAARLLWRAADAEETGLPEDPSMWPVWQLLAPHATHVFDSLATEPDGPDDAVVAASGAVGLVARYLGQQALYAQAEAQLRKVLAVRKKALGPDDVATLVTRHSIARRMAERGDHAGAEAEFRDVLAARLRVLGRGHRSTLNTRHEVAAQMAARGNHAGAEAEFRDVLAVRLQMQGPDHPETLTTRHSIARQMAERGDPTGAEAEFRDVLAARLRVLGLEHPDTLGTRHEIARMMAEQGNHAGAETEFRDVLAARLRVLGPDHRRTLTTRYEIALQMAKLRNYDDAEAEFRDVLAAEVRVLGPEHPYTRVTAQRIEDLEQQKNA
jgi:RecA/RadA recombinase